MRVTIDRDAVVRRLRENGAQKMERLAQQVLEDSNEFVPWDSGMLARSGRVEALPDGGAEVRWEAPYAGALYRGVTPAGRPVRYATDKNPAAQREWFEAARRKRAGWRRLMQELFGGGG